MVIFDQISYRHFAELRKKLTNAGIEYKKISELHEDLRIDSAICVFSLSFSFFDFDSFEFLKHQKIFKGLSIVLALNRGFASGRLENSSIAVSWVHALVGPRRKDYKVISEVDREDQDYMFEIINNQVNPQPKVDRNKFKIYTDGACSGNPGCGGWAAVIISEDKTEELFGGEFDTTNNRMEILAAIKALESLKSPSDIELYSDSAYLVNTFELGWIEQWKRNHWRNSDKVLVKNIDLWQKLDALTDFHNVKFFKVKGHADVEYNNICDKLAVAETKRLTAILNK